MAVNVFELFGKIGADDKPASDAIDRIVAKARNAESAMSKNLVKIGDTVSGWGKAISVGFTAPMTVAGGSLVKTGVQFNVFKQQSQIAFETMLGSAEKAQTYLDDMYTFAKKTPFAYPDLVTAGRNMVSFGMSAEETIPILETLGDAVVATGGSSADIGALADVFGKIKSNGRLALEEINMLTGRGVPALQILANKMGITTEEVRKQISSGAIESNEAISMMIDGMKEGTNGLAGETAAMGGLMNKLKGTFTGSVDSMKSSWRNAGGEITAGLTDNDGALTSLVQTITRFNKQITTTFAPAIDSLKNNLGGFAEFAENVVTKFEGLSDGSKGMVGAMLSLTAVSGPALYGFGKLTSKVGEFTGAIEKGSEFLKDYGKLMSDNFASLFSGADAPLSGLKSKFTGAMFDLKLGGAMAMDSLEEKFGAIVPKMEQLGSGFMSFGGKILNGVTGLIGPAFKLLAPGALIGLLLAGMGLAQSQFGDQIQQFINLAITKGPEIITGFVNGITSKLPDLIQQGAVMLEGLMKALTANAPAIIGGAVQIIVTLVKGLADNLPTLIPAALEMISTIVLSLIDALPELLEAGLQLLVALVEGITSNIDIIIDTVVDIIIKFAEILIENLPILIEAAIKIMIALSVGLIKAIPKLLEAVPKIFKALVKAFGGIDWGEIGNSILVALGEAIADLAEYFDEPIEWIKKAWNGMVDWFKDLGKGIKHSWDGVLDWFDSIAKGFGKICDDIKNFFKSTPNWFKQQWENIKKIFSDALKAVTGFIEEHFGWIGPYISGVFEGIQQYVGAAFEIIKNLILGPLLLIVDMFTGNFDKMGEHARQIFDNIKNAIGDAWDGIKLIFDNTLGAIWEWVSQIFTDMWEWISTKMGEISDTIVQTWDSVISWLTTLPGRIGEWVAKAFNDAKTTVSTKMQEIWQSIVDKWNAIISWMAGLPGRMYAAATSAIQSMINGVKAWINDIKTTIENKWNEAVNFLKGIDLWEIGKNIIDSMIRGIKSMWESLKKTCSDMADSVIGWFEDVLDINSPSRVFREIGGFVSEGLALGIEDNGDMVLGAVDNIAKAMTDVEMPDLMPPNITAQTLGRLNPAAFGYTTGTFGATKDSQGQDPATRELLMVMQDFTRLMRDGGLAVQMDGRTTGKVLEQHLDNSFAETSKDYTNSYGRRDNR